ncbi:DUF7370 family protein, partial [Xenorhabdus beddingii]|uniref:DUF7370 family protein n=1 Tax=Xenorhabdus beddingii TaxID=40578 RepID=UPI003BB5D22D
MAITLTDIKPMIAELGFTLPDSVLELLLGRVNERSECMASNGYDESLQKLLLIYATVRLASLSGARKIA